MIHRLAAVARHTAPCATRSSRWATPRSFGAAADELPAVGSAGLDWGNIGFDFQKSAGFVKYTWRNGSWDEGVFEPEPYLKLHVMSSAIHYGQAIYEGAKAHHCQDGKLRLWNIESNARRMVRGCERMMMPEVPVDMFRSACEWAVRANRAYVPPFGSNGSMYLRPYIFGHGPQLGLAPAPEFHFCVLAIPVASYYKSGLMPIDSLIIDSHDRAAPQGVGNVKASGNYGADILPSLRAKALGYPTVLYLDAKHKKHIEEFSVSNFIGVVDAEHSPSGKPKYVTPKSDSVLMSTTNECLMQLAGEQWGYEVEHRPVEAAELGDFQEVAGCGTAVVMMGVKSLTRGDTVWKYNESLEHVGAMYSRYRAIQFGEAEDVYGWGTEVPSHAAVSMAGAGGRSNDADASMASATAAQTLSRAVPRDS